MRFPLEMSGRKKIEISCLPTHLCPIYPFTSAAHLPTHRLLCLPARPPSVHASLRLVVSDAQSQLMPGLCRALVTLRWTSAVCRREDVVRQLPLSGQGRAGQGWQGVGAPFSCPLLSQSTSPGMAGGTNHKHLRSLRRGQRNKGVYLPGL